MIEKIRGQIIRGHITYLPMIEGFKAAAGSVARIPLDKSLFRSYI